jgi:hypothetical protein
MRLGEFYASLDHDIECSYCGARYERKAGSSPIWAEARDGTWYHYCEQQWHPCRPLEENGDGPDETLLRRRRDRAGVFPAHQEGAGGAA